MPLQNRKELVRRVGGLGHHCLPEAPATCLKTPLDTKVLCHFQGSALSAASDLGKPESAF